MPKKRKPKSKPTQKQSQRQSVVVNIGSTSKRRKSSGKGRLPPPSHMHNLAPTFITAPQVDYTPLLAMMQHNASRLVAQEPISVRQTPLSSTLIASNAEQMAGEAAIRRAGPTADNFQPLPSLADERVAPTPQPSPISFTPKEKKKKPIKTITKIGGEEKGYVPKMTIKKKPPKASPVSEPSVRPPDPYYTKTLQDLGSEFPVEAEARTKRGRPFKTGVVSADPVEEFGVSRLPKQNL